MGQIFYEGTPTEAQIEGMILFSCFLVFYVVNVSGEQPPTLDEDAHILRYIMM